MELVVVVVNRGSGCVVERNTELVLEERSLDDNNDEDNTGKTENQ